MTAPPREKKAYIRSLGEEEVNLSAILSPEEDDITTNDMLLAQMLQYEFDREYDQQVEREERQYNGNSKGTYALNMCKCGFPVVFHIIFGVIKFLLHRLTEYKFYLQSWICVSCEV